MKIFLSIIFALLFTVALSFATAMFIVNTTPLGFNWVWILTVWFYIILFGIENIITTIINNNRKITSHRVYAEKTKYQKVEVSCCKCFTKNVVDVNIVKDNFFDCQNCKTHNKVICAFKGVQPSDVGSDFDWDNSIKNGDIENG